MVDIQGAANASSQQVVSSGRAGSIESAVAERRAVEDSSIERREAEPSDTQPGVGEQVDIQA
ncbi:hypothetical protein [Kordiimonas laminariae]|uniref:hypothetical protein n=1 Tax=Kordiimonas laminariae TaxID=2917717 RepID=UPI001FF2B331|nr:hypothetical protein [Kordiimonas laminariae]MCK0069936.1 hypothetical protein [Kordiimonas laminariae]